MLDAYGTITTETFRDNIFYLLVWTGKDASNPDQTFIEVMEASNANPAFVWGTMASSLTSVLFYFIS